VASGYLSTMGGLSGSNGQAGRRGQTPKTARRYHPTPGRFSAYQRAVFPSPPVDPAGFEPASSGFPARRATRLPYGPTSAAFVFVGAFPLLLQVTQVVFRRASVAATPQR
jgi:hypothetical protein